MRLRQTAGLFAGFFGVACPVARGADYLVTASGSLASVLSEAKAFDGTNITTLPDILDLDRLQGGTFRATYRFTPVAPQLSGNDAVYQLSPTSGMISYDLLDSSGVVVHRGTNPSEPLVLVENNYGNPPYSVDQVLLTSNVNNVTGWHVPNAVYSASPDFHSVADFNLNGYVDNSTNYLNDLGIPTDAATYLSFPIANVGRAFDVLIEFGDGDYGNQSGPFQHVFAQLQYDITALEVTAVPEPAGMTLMLLAGMIRFRRRALRR